MTDLMSTDWWGPCLPEAHLETAWATVTKDLRLPRTCSEEPTRDPAVLASLFGREPTALELGGASYAYCREEGIEDCHFDVPVPIPVPATGLLLALALVALLVMKKPDASSDAGRVSR